MSRSKANPSNPSPLRVTAYGVALLALGLLLWARFLLVTGHPRTAIAVPPAKAPVAQANPAPAQAPAHADAAADEHR